mgnify:CR=1 FL=1
MHVSEIQHVLSYPFHYYIKSGPLEVVLLEKARILGKTLFFSQSYPGFLFLLIQIFSDFPLKNLHTAFYVLILFKDLCNFGCFARLIICSYVSY